MYRGSFRNGGNLFPRLPPFLLGREQYYLPTKRPADPQSFLQPNGEEEVVRTSFQPQMFVIHSLINSSSQIARHIAIALCMISLSAKVSDFVETVQERTVAINEGPWLLSLAR